MTELTDLETGDGVELLKDGGAWNDDETVIGEVTDVREPETIHCSDVERDDEIVVVATADGDAREISTDNGQFSVVDVTGSEDGPEIVTDGGEDTTDDLSDGGIAESIEKHDDPDHPDAATVNGVRNVLARINDDVLAHWDAHQDAIDDNALEVVHEDRDSIVLADRSGHFWSEQLDALNVEDGPLRTVIKSLHHTRARARCDHSWSAVDPVVVRKTAGFRAGEQQVLREVARRTAELGSVARAVDTLAVETHGWSKGNWARLTDRNPSTVTRMTDN